MCLLAVLAWVSKIVIRPSNNTTWDSLSFNFRPSSILNLHLKVSHQALYSILLNKSLPKRQLYNNSKFYFRWQLCSSNNTRLSQMGNLQHRGTLLVESIFHLDKRPCRTSPFLKFLQPRCPILTQLELYSTTLVKSLMAQVKMKKMWVMEPKKEATLMKYFLIWRLSFNI